MALAIDTSRLTTDVEMFNSFWLKWGKHGPVKGLFQMYRACAVATVIHDTSSISRLTVHRPAARQEALDWRPDSDDELDDMEVLHHLNKQAKSSPVLEAAFSHTNRSIASTTVMASCAIPPSSLPASAQGRPLSSFHRASIRWSWLQTPRTLDRYTLESSNAIDHFEIPRLLNLLSFYLPRSYPFRPWLVDQSDDQCVAWQVQFDIVDYSRRRGHPNCHLQRGRRSTINLFHRLSAPRIPEDSQSNPRKETKQFRGVRYREDHKRWTAEVKPPNFRNKVHFGEFKSQTQAARVVDVAYHYYSKPLNFSDTPLILEARPIPANITDEDKLKFVKEQAKWVSSIYSTLPFPPPNGEVDGGRDDGTSQPQLSVHLETTGGLVSDGLARGSVRAEVVVGGAVTNTLEAQQGLPEWRPSDFPSYSPTSSLCIIEDEDGAEHSTGPSSINLRSPSEPSCDSHAQPDDGEVMMSGRGNAKRLRFKISAHQFTPRQVEVAESFTAFTAATPVFPLTFSPSPSDRDADQGDNGMCESHPCNPMAGLMEPNRVEADRVDGGAVTGTLQEQKALSVPNVGNLLCSSLSSPSSFIDITDGAFSVHVAPTNYGIYSQFSFESQGMATDFLMMSPPPSIPSSATPFDYLPDHALCLWEQQEFGPDWLSG